MIKKDKFISQIDKLVNSDKSLVPLLNRHITSSLMFSDLEKADRGKLIEFFQKRVIVQTKHLEALNEIKQVVTKDKRDVY